MKILRLLSLQAAMVASAFVIMHSSAFAAGRDESTINSHWEFRMPHHKDWTTVNLPHTYNSDAYDGMNYYRGKAHYRKKLSVPAIDASRCYFLRFDAASKAAEVSLNDSLIGTHAGGYTKFTINVSDLLRSENILEVTVDNDRPDVTPISADFTFFGGIYRDVWLISTPAIHFDMSNMGSDGIFITTPSVSEKEACVTVRSGITNDSANAADLILHNQLYAPDGSLVAQVENKLRLRPGETKYLESAPLKVTSPALWSPESPTLYTVKTIIKNAKTREEIERRSNSAAFRWFAFDGNKGFSLNGKPYKLRGFNRHQDQWPVGVALPDEAHRRDIMLQKELGANFIRIAHYPQDDAVLQMCDEIGLLAWEEIPIVNIVPDTPGYAGNCETNLREMIRQHFNHPSVIAWGYMNEILLTTPRPDNEAWPPVRDRTVALARRLEAALKEEDPTRASVMAYNMTNLYNEIGLDLGDVAGWNLYHGWYVGNLPDFNKYCEDQHLRYPDRPMIISEWGAGSDRRLHSDEARPFDFTTEYQQTYVEHYLPFIEQTEWIAGCAYWNFIDFNVAARQESMPRVNNKGIAYNDRSWKDIAYYFKSMWRKDIPVVHIASRDHPTRIGSEGDKHFVKVYSNLPEVELSINGRSLGRKSVRNCSATFEVELPEGHSTLAANAGDAYDAMVITRQPVPDLAKGDELAVNVGSNCNFTSGLSHLTWLADRPYSNGKWGHTGGNHRSTTSEIVNTIDGPLYQSWREGDFSYRFDAPEGEYEVELLLADVSKPAAQLANLLDRSNSEVEKDMARFDILINGKMVEQNFSPAEDGRYRTAFKRRYIIDNAADAIEIALRPITGNPHLAAIKIRRLHR